MTKTLTGLDRARTFLESIQKRLNIKVEPNQPTDKNAKQDTGATAALKRALTGEDKHLRDVYSIVLPPLERVGIEYSQDNRYRQDEWIFVACLFAYYPQKLDQDDKRNFGHSCGLLQQQIRQRSPDAKGIDRRFRALLDTSLEDLRSPLSALARLMKSKDKNIAINYPQLIVDLDWWEPSAQSKQSVQDKWARAFWGAPEKPPEERQEAVDDVNE